MEENNSTENTILVFKSLTQERTRINANLCISTIKRKYNGGKFMKDWIDENRPVFIPNYTFSPDDGVIYVIDTGSGFKWGYSDKNLYIYEKNNSKLQKTDKKLNGNIKFISNFVYNKENELSELYRSYIREDVKYGYIKFEESDHSIEDQWFDCFLHGYDIGQVVNPFTNELDDNLTGIRVTWSDVDLDMEYDEGTYISEGSHSGWYEQPGWICNDGKLVDPEVTFLWEDQEISDEQFAKINQFPIDILNKIKKDVVSWVEGPIVEESAESFEPPEYEPDDD